MTARRLGLVLALPAVCLGLASCKGLPGDSVAKAPPAPSGASPGGTLTVGVTPPGGIDPVGAYEPVGKLISSTMCDTVVTLDPVTGQVREGLAQSLVFSPDGSTLTFKMRRHLRFNDGSELAPSDVDFSLRLLHAASTASYVKGLVAPFVGPGGKGESVLADDVVGGKESKPIIQTLNEADFQVSGGQGNGGAVRIFAEPAMAPISQAAYRKDPVAFAQSPVCAGPYRLASPYRAGDRTITLVRSKTYHGQNVGYTSGGDGYADRIVFSIFPTPELAYAAFGQGKVDVVAVPPTRAADARRLASSLVTGSRTTVDFLGLPTGLDPYRSTVLRQAMSLALDRKALARTLGPSSVAGTGFLPSALAILPGANGIRSGAVETKDAGGAVPVGCADLAPAADPVRAKALLARAKREPAVGPALSKPLKLYVNQDGGYPALARLAARQWHDVLGIDVQVVPLAWNDYVQKATQGPGFDGAFHLGWATDTVSPEPLFNDPQAFVTPLFAGRGSSNWAHWSSADFDFALQEDAAKTSSVRDRGVFFAGLEKLLCKELPMIPVAFSSPEYLVRKGAWSTARPSYLGQSTGAPLLREMFQR